MIKKSTTNCLTKPSSFNETTTLTISKEIFLFLMGRSASHWAEIIEAHDDEMEDDEAEVDGDVCYELHGIEKEGELLVVTSHESFVVLTSCTVHQPCLFSSAYIREGFIRPRVAQT